MTRAILAPVLPAIRLAQRPHRLWLPSRPSSLLSPAARRPRPINLQLRPATYAPFHSTPRAQGPAPLIPIFAVLLKTSGAMEIARTAARIVLSFVPLILLKNKWSRRIILAGRTRHGQPISDEKRELVLKRIKQRASFLRMILLVPLVLFWGTIVASLERTPLTGRWRMIILSPEEESEIAAQLAGPGWYRAVGAILAEDGVSSYIPPTDWRYLWVNETLRMLEDTIPVLASEPEHCPDWYEDNADRQGKPMPPPAEFPLLPRSRVAEYLKTWCDKITEHKTLPPGSHTIPGPPYSLLVVEGPDAKNAFSYGFGGDGGGGVVVYSGFLDDIFRRHPAVYKEEESAQSKPWWSRLIGAFSSKPTLPHPTPTPEQTTELAILLAHELSHLILAHHLETYSSGTVIVPGILSILSDVVRVAVFPFTMLFGPFVNDAVAQLGKVGSGELTKLGQHCMSMKQEVEADVVSARLLAHAGFDAREAINFWENRKDGNNCSGLPKAKPDGSLNISLREISTLARGITGETHPVIETRIDYLKKELQRWEQARLAALASTRSLPSSTSMEEAIKST